MILGVSVYPEQEALQEIDAYLAMASSYGFTKVFTSMFSIEGTKEEVIRYFKDFAAIAHKYGMQTAGDCNAMFFEKVGATESDLSPFKEMGIDIIRMDFSFQDERDAILINNQEGIKIEMSAAFAPVIETALQNGANPHRMAVCHNFYPQLYTAPSLDAVLKTNAYWKAKGIDVAIFVSSQVKNTHGPWPVCDGLPTIEEHRTLPLAIQIKHCLSFKNVDEILIGNAFASEAELQAVDQMMKQAMIDVPIDETRKSLSMLLPHGRLTRIPFTLQLDEGISDVEKAIVFDYKTHNDMGDCMHYMLRSRMTRFFYQGCSIPKRECKQTHFTKGDVMIVNDNCKHYVGEVQICLKEMEVDGQRNLIGHIEDQELMILDQIKANDIFTFMAK